MRVGVSAWRRVGRRSPLGTTERLGVERMGPMGLMGMGLWVAFGPLSLIRRSPGAACSKRFLFGSARPEMTERSIDSVHLPKLLAL
jgi:hypothetical protein